ncbi:MAG: hypothetical protein J6U86_06520 [Clostridia bacterium]|nr:hypothetical protein [Clostridia bacterium]
MSKELNFLILLKVLKAAWWKILVFTVAIAIAVSLFVEFVIPKKYASKTEFYILNTSTTSEYTTTALLSAAEYLANDYIEIINGDKMMEAVLADIAEKGYVTYSPNSIRSMISASTSADSSTFNITVTSTDKDLAFYICDSIKDNAPDIIKGITRPSYSSSVYRKTNQKDENGNDIYVPVSEEDLECVKVIRAPELSKSHVYPNVFTMTLVSAVFAACAAYVFFLIRKLADTVIHSEDGAKELIDETIIGDIPNWTVHTSDDDNASEEQK